MSKYSICAAFYDLPIDVVAAMEADKAAAAADFWSYPGGAWQFNFEADWLRERGYIEAADKAANCAANAS